VPAQPPEATQLVALLEDQVSFEIEPLFRVVGFAVSVTAGAGSMTETVTAWVATPPTPEHVKAYVALAFNAPVDCDPLSPLDPIQGPVALQVVALLAVQRSVAELPLVTVLGVASKLIVGGGAVTDTVAVCTAVPAGPVQLNV